MSLMKNKALEILYDLHYQNNISTEKYLLLQDAIKEIETIKDRDSELEDLWAQLEDVPMDPETELLEAPFADWPAGTHREDVWHWFDKRYSKGIAHLLYNDGVDRTDQIATLVYRHQLCDDCESTSCAYNHDGVCHFPMVHGRKPLITDEDGCTEGCVQAHVR